MALIVLATLAPFVSSGPARPGTWCTLCSPTWAADAVANVLLFVPLGAALARAGALGWRSIFAAAALSVIVETLQYLGIPSGRTASTLDVLSNASGAAVGLYLCRTVTVSTRLRSRESLLPAVAWSLTCSIVLWGSALATQAGSGQIGRIRSSRFAYAPGFGWYGGRVLDARIGDQLVPHSGVGPIVVESDRTAAWLDVKVRTTRRDTASNARALFLVHTSSDSSYDLVVLQHGDAATARVRRYSQSWGLHFPSLALENVFSPSRVNDTVSIRVTVSPDEIRIEGSRPNTGEPAVARLPLTSLLGWSMLQDFLRPATFAGKLATTLWIFLIFFPAGWLVFRAESFASPVSSLIRIGCAGLLLSGLVGPKLVLGCSVPTPSELMQVTCATLAGAAAARFGGQLRHTQPNSKSLTKGIHSVLRK